MKSEKLHDAIYAEPREMVVDFAFDETVAKVFPDMIRRSVPGYDVLIPMLGVLAERFVQPGSRVYDLGCSLGAATLAMRRRLAGCDCRFVAVDNAEAMVTRCRENMAAEAGLPVEVVQADLREVAIADASLVVLNFTLQFIPPEERMGVLSGIARRMRPGGALVLSEKVRYDEPVTAGLFTELHHGFKRANGYSDLEISQKRTALEKVLIPETLAVHQERLLAAGFSRCEVWFQCLNFASILAVK